MKGVKEGTDDEHRMVYGSDESLNSTPKTSITLYINWNLNKKQKIKQTLFVTIFSAPKKKLGDLEPQT